MPSRHPALHISPEDLPALRERLAKGLPATFFQKLLADCQRLMTPGDAWYIDFEERESELWRERHGIFQVILALESLSVAHALSNDQRYGAYAKGIAMAIIDHGLADVKSVAYGVKNEGWRHGMGHDKGNFARAMAWTYNMCHNQFSQAERERFASFAAESMRLADEYRRADVDQVANNRGIRGLLVHAWYHLALEGDAELESDREGHYQAAIHYLDVHLTHCYAADGACYEGPDYVVMASLASLADALARRGQPNVLTHNRFERLATYYLYELLPGGGTVNNLNDAEFPCGSVMHFLHTMPTPAGKIIPWLAEQLDLHPLQAETETLSDPWRVLAVAKWWDESLPVASPTELGYPTSWCFQQRGLADLRTGWGADDWLVSHFCGREQRRCHRQADFNHFSLYALGEHFLADPGYGKLMLGRDMTKEVDRWFQDADVHNCILIDGAGGRNSNRYAGWCEGEMLDFLETDAFATSLGDASGVFVEPQRVRRSLRRLVLVKDVSIPFLIVLDVNEKDGEPFEARHVWQTWVDNRLEPEAKGFTIFGKTHRCEARVFSRQPCRIERADGPLPKLQVIVQAAVTQVVTVFFPLRSGQQVPLLSCEHVDDGQVSITCQGHHIRLSTQLQGPLQIPTPVVLKAENLAES